MSQWLIVAALSIGQGSSLDADARLDRHVSYRAAAANAGEALEGLSKPAGIQLKAAQVIGSEVLLVRVQDVPLREVMARIAAATGGVWTQSGEAYFLGRAPNWEAQRAEALSIERATALKKKLAEQAAYVTKLMQFDAAAADVLVAQVKKVGALTAGNHQWTPEVSRQWREVQGATPDSRLGIRVFSRLDPQWLARLSLGKRTVFSTSPNAMERPMPYDLSDSVDQFVAEQNMWADRVAASDIGSDPNTRGLLGDTSRVEDRPAKVLIVVNAGEMGDSIDVDLKLQDAKGGTLSSASREFSFDPDSMPDPSKLAQRPNETRMELDPDDRIVIQNLLAKFGDPSTSKVPLLKLTDSVTKQLQRPDLHEPLAGYVSQFILKAADERSLNVVADAPDIYLMMVGLACLSGMPTAGGLIRTLQAMPGNFNPVKFEGSWMEVDGGKISGFWGHRSDRVEMANLFSSCENGMFPTEALAKYAFNTGDRHDDFMVMLLGRILSDSMGDPSSPEWDTYSLLGALIQRFGVQILRAPTTAIPINRLDPDSLHILSGLVYSHNFESTISMSPPPPGAGPGTVMHPRNVPEELFPNGLPPNGQIEIDTRSENELMVRMPGQRERNTGSGEIAMVIEQRDHPDAFPGLDTTRLDLSNATFAFSSTNLIQVSLQLGGILHPMPEVRQHAPPNGGFVPYDQLPEAFKKEVSRDMDRYELVRKHSG